MQPKVYAIDEHQIALDQIDEHAEYVIRKLRQSGYKAYLVGGGVRDLLLKKKPKDFDVSTSARPEEIRSLFRNAILIGRRFRLAHIRFGQKIIEVSTFRSGATEAAGLITRDNEWGTEEQDVLRRDFTINGLFYDPETQTVIDYVDGYPDLDKQVLRTIGTPEVRFMQDPVRMIRLIKFCARFGFAVDRLTFEALLNCKEEIVKSSPARILEELFRMLESGASRTFFHLLNEYGILKQLTPPLSEIVQNQENLGLLAVIDEEVQKGNPLDRALLLSALVFPFFAARIQKETPKHLGQVGEIAHTVVDDLFSPFFQVPRRLTGIVGFLLTSQCRFIPLDGKPIRRPRPPRDPLFPMALHLLKIRASQDPALLPHLSIWNEVSFSAHALPIDEPPQRRRRRRRRAS